MPDEGFEERINTILDHARLKELSGEWIESIRLLESGIDVAGDNPRLRVKLLPPLACLLWKRGEMPRAEALLSEAYETAESSGDEETLSEVYYQLGEIHYAKQFYMNDAEAGEGLPFHEKALDLRLKLNNRNGASDSYSRIGTIHERLEDWEKAHQCYQEATKIAEETGYSQGLIRPLTHIGGFHRRQGDEQKALEHHQEALRVSRESGNQEDTMFSIANVAQIRYRINGDSEEALSLCREALEIAERTGFKLAVARVHFGIALIHLRENCSEKAREHFLRVIEISEDAGLLYFIGPAEEQLGKI
jgi:tetratricopeptide (TPR) repeat protein